MDRQSVRIHVCNTHCPTQLARAPVVHSFETTAVRNRSVSAWLREPSHCQQTHRSAYGSEGLYPPLLLPVASVVSSGEYEVGLASDAAVPVAGVVGE